jgi:predicted nucleotide-binding protein
MSKLGLDVIILSEQPNQGRTIIEKFEHYARVSFALVILTPDDQGGRRGDMQQPRARQNVILELGFFIGKLGRERVAALATSEIERPSDVDGVLYIPYDKAGAWKYKLADELRAAGLPVDMNKLTP